MLPLGAGGTVGDCPVAVVAAVVVGVVVAGVAVAVVVVVAVPVVEAAVSPSESGSGFMVKMGGRVSTQQEREKKMKKRVKAGQKKKDFVFQIKSFFLSPPSNCFSSGPKLQFCPRK